MVCQDNIEFMRGLPDASIKLIVTSPPYNLGVQSPWVRFDSVSVRRGAP